MEVDEQLVTEPCREVRALGGDPPAFALGGSRDRDVIGVGAGSLTDGGLVLVVSEADRTNPRDRRDLYWFGPDGDCRWRAPLGNDVDFLTADDRIWLRRNTGSLAVERLVEVDRDGAIRRELVLPPIVQTMVTTSDGRLVIATGLGRPIKLWQALPAPAPLATGPVWSGYAAVSLAPGRDGEVAALHYRDENQMRVNPSVTLAVLRADGTRRREVSVGFAYGRAHVVADDAGWIVAGVTPRYVLPYTPAEPQIEVLAFDRDLAVRWRSWVPAPARWTTIRVPVRDGDELDLLVLEQDAITLRWRQSLIVFDAANGKLRRRADQAALRPGRSWLVAELSGRQNVAGHTVTTETWFVEREHSHGWPGGTFRVDATMLILVPPAAP